MLSARKIRNPLLFFIVALFFFIFFTQAMEQLQKTSTIPDKTSSLVTMCLADIKKNCGVIRKSAQYGMLHYSTTLDQGSWITASQNKQPQTYLVFYTVKQNGQNQCTPVYGENAFIIFKQLELLCKKQLPSVAT